MIIRILLPILLLFNYANAYFMTQNNSKNGNEILKSFDIDVSFLKESMYASAKEVENKYKTTHFLRVLRDGRDIVPMLRKMLKEEGVPDIFLYLAMAESNFHLHAKSRSRAVGLWQFVKATGQHFGLKIDRYVDERKDPIKSTQAAIKYLQYLHNMFGKWYLAAMAYNCGEARVRKAIKNAQSDNIAILLDEEKKYIPGETRRYIGKILAMASVSLSEEFMLENNADYLLNQGESLIFEKVYVPANTSLGSIAQSIGVSSKTLKIYNPHLRYFFTPPNVEKYHVYLPYGKSLEFAKKFKSNSKNNNYKGHKVHVVKKGDSLYTIAKKYQVKLSLLKDYNNFKRKYLKIGQKIIVPSLHVEDMSMKSIKIKNIKRQYIVKKGDTLGSISQRFKVKVSDVREINKKKNSFIKPGEKIVIPSN